MARPALIIVDMQYDFLPGGALGVEGGDEIIDGIIKEANYTHNRSGLVIASRDYHPADHCSFSDDPQYTDYDWPAHCVQGTKGVKIHPKIKAVADIVISKGEDSGEEAYSAFAGGTLKPKKSLERILKEEDIDYVNVCGLAYDYCVKHTALDSEALGYPTTVFADLSRPVDKLTAIRATIILNSGGVLVSGV